MLPRKDFGPCAGCRKKEFHLSRLPGIVRPRERMCLIISPARFRGIVEFGGIGFMSTQRREIRLNCSGFSSSAEGIGQSRPSSPALNYLTDSDGGTAPLDFTAYFHLSDEGLSPGTLEWLATNSLQSDYRFRRDVLFVWLVQLVALVQFVSSIGPGRKFNTRLGLPLFRVGRRPATGTPASYRLSYPFSPIPSAISRLLLT